MRWPWALVALMIVASAIALCTVTTAPYDSAAQEPDPTIDPAMIAALPLLVPQVAPSEYDHTNDGVVNVADVQQTAAHQGETGLRPVCAIVLYPGLRFKVRTC